jgi:hypothetical protein
MPWAGRQNGTTAADLAAKGECERPNIKHGYARWRGWFCHQASTGSTGKYHLPRITLPIGKPRSGSLRHLHQVTALTSPQSFRSLGAGSQRSFPGFVRRDSPDARLGAVFVF